MAGKPDADCRTGRSSALILYMMHEAVSEAAAVYEKATAQNSISFEEMKKLLQAYPSEKVEELPEDGQSNQEEKETPSGNTETEETVENGGNRSDTGRDRVRIGGERRRYPGNGDERD